MPWETAARVAGVAGGGATFFAQAPQNRIAPSVSTRVSHFFIGSFTLFLQFLCAQIVACNLQIHGGAHDGPAVKKLLAPSF